MNEINIRLRQEQLRDLQEYVKDLDKDITLILQSLQWDRKHLQQGKQMLTCKYDLNHRILENNVKEHEEKCNLKRQNYVPGDLFFSEPLDTNAATVVKLSAENIKDIINYAAKTDPSFRKSSGSEVSGQAPLTLGRLQAAHSSDERRALYDAVVAAAPPPAPLGSTDLDPATDDPAAVSTRGGSYGDALLALRDARRRRAKHRGAAREGYQQELRGLISAQMESFTGKCNAEDADTKADVTNDEFVAGRRYEHESDRLDHVRNDGRVKYLNPYRRGHRESREDKRRENERETREDKRRENERETREDKRRENEKETREDKRRKYERENREDKRGVYERNSKDDKRREHEYDKKYKERNKIYEHEDRRRQYDKEYLEIKQEKDDYPSDRRKREERRYDYKNRKQESARSRSRDNKKYHKREERHHKRMSAERRRGRSGDKEYDRNYKSNIDCSYLKIKKEPPDYD